MKHLLVAAPARAFETTHGSPVNGCPMDGIAMGPVSWRFLGATKDGRKPGGCAETIGLRTRKFFEQKSGRKAFAVDGLFGHMSPLSAPETLDGTES